LPKAPVIFVMSVYPSARIEQLDSHGTDFHEIWYLSILRKSVEKIRIPLNSNKNNGHFTWPIYMCIMSRSIFLDWRTVQIEVVEIIKTHFLFNPFFRKSCHSWEGVRKNIVDTERPQMTIWRMHIGCWNPKATDTHSQYVTHSLTTAATVVRKRLDVRFLVHSLPCCKS